MTCARDIKPAPMAPPDDLIPVAEAATLAERSVYTVRRWIKERRLRGWRRLGLLYVSKSEVEGSLAYIPDEPK